MGYLRSAATPVRARRPAGKLSKVRNLRPARAPQGPRSHLYIRCPHLAALTLGGCAALAALALGAPALAQAPAGSTTHAAAPSATPAPSPVAAVLRKHGIRPVQPPTPATDFTLPNLQGQEVALSASEGRWVLLTFFATWCGPCATEMPSLETLHQRKGPAGVHVVGVAIESDASKVQAFTSSKGVTFPVVLDASSQVASIYRASSIPTSYVIDPEGRLVGVARGARDWAQMAPLFDDLLTLSPARDDAVAQYRQGAAPVELPSTLVPPEAEVTLASPGPFQPNKPIELRVQVRWAGNFQDYLLLPPEVHTPQGVSTQGTSAVTSTRDGKALITYRIELRAEKPGSFALDPVELRYTPHLENEPVAQRVSGPTVTVVEASLPPALTLGSGGLALLLLSGGAALWWRKRERRPAEPAAQPVHVALAEQLERAKRAKLRGEAATVVEALHAFETLCPDGDPAALAPLLEKVRYGGYTPPAHELEAMLRAAQRRLAKHSPTTSPTEGIKLKDPTSRESQP